MSLDCSSPGGSCSDCMGDLLPFLLCCFELFLASCFFECVFFYLPFGLFFRLLFCFAPALLAPSYSASFGCSSAPPCYSGWSFGCCSASPVFILSCGCSLSCGLSASSREGSYICSVLVTTSVESSKICTCWCDSPVSAPLLLEAIESWAKAVFWPCAGTMKYLEIWLDCGTG